MFIAYNIYIQFIHHVQETMCSEIYKCFWMIAVQWPTHTFLQFYYLHYTYILHFIAQ